MQHVVGRRRTLYVRSMGGKFRVPLRFYRALAVSEGDTILRYYSILLYTGDSPNIMYLVFTVFNLTSAYF